MPRLRSAARSTSKTVSNTNDNRTTEITYHIQRDGTRCPITLGIHPVESIYNRAFDFADDFLNWAKVVVLRSREKFLEVGSHPLMIGCITAREVIQTISTLSPAETAAWLKHFIRERQVIGAIVFGEAWVYTPKGPRDHTLTQLWHGEMAIHDLSDHDRSEELFLLAQTRSGFVCQWSSPITRLGSRVELGETSCGIPIPGLFTGLFDE